MEIGSGFGQVETSPLEDREQEVLRLDALLKPKDVQKLLGMGKSSVYHMLATGQIKSVVMTGSRRRRCYRVRPSDLEDWIREHENAA